jgi:MFS family permease
MLRRRWQLARSSPPPPSPFGEGRAIRRLMLFFAIVYVVEGIGQARVGVILQPLTNYLKTHGWSPLEVTAYFGVLNFPWVIKPVFGLVSDFVPLFGYRRTSYLLLASAGAAVGYAGVALLNEPSEFALLLLLTSYAMATASTLCGALLAENGRTFQQSSLFVGQQWLWFYVAIMASAFMGGVLVEYLPASSALKAAAGIAAVAPIAVMIATPLLLSEPKSSASREAFRETLQGIGTALKSRKLWLVALFLFLYSFAPGFGTPLYYYMTDTLRFSQAYIGFLGSIASAGWIAGALLHRWLMRRMDAENLLYLSIVLGTLSAGSFLLLGSELSAAIVNFANGLAMMIATIASLTVAAQYCPRRAEGFAFAGLMSVSNLADIFSINTGAFLYERVFHSHLAPLIVVSAATTAIAAVLVPLLDLRSNPAQAPT